MPLVFEPSWVGRRVTVRLVAGSRSDGRPQFTDVVGELLSVDGGRAVIETRRGLVVVALTDVQIARIAPPSTGDELALEAVAARGWRAAQTGKLGGWLLRANDGLTGRANSVLPLAAPGVPLDEALDTARAWYAERGLPLRVQVPVEARRLLDAELAERGWPADPDVHVMATRLDTPAATDVGVTVTLAGEPDDDWLARFRDGSTPSASTRALLTRHETVVFASIRVDGLLAAIGRGVVDDTWLGVTAVEVAPAQRRRGLATVVMAALHGWGVARGALHGYLQVSVDNVAAVALYEGLGYWVHHDYRYRSEPGDAAT
jgi:N-acetylglutamate synthase